MRATISIVTHNRVDMTRECLKWISRHIDSNVEVILSDNASSDDTIASFLSSPIQNKKLIRYGINAGFGFAHNQALNIASGEYFIVLNNDIFLHDSDFLNKLIDPLEKDENVGLVGIQDVPSMLKPDGYGMIGNKLEYIDGACIVGRTKQFKEFGLFSPAIEKFYFEDSDLSLRFRQMGFKLKTAQIAHTHHRGSTAKFVQYIDKAAIMKANQRVFLSRWSKYLQVRQFVNKILIKINSAGIGDVVCLTPLLEGLKNDHPTATIELETNQPEVFFNNPNISVIHNHGVKHKQAFDRIIDIAPNYMSPDLICRMGEIQSATKLNDYTPQLFCSQSEIKEAAELLSNYRKKDSIIVMVALQMNRFTWEGRNWPHQHVKNFIRLLREVNDNIVIVELGHGVTPSGEADVDLVDKTNLRQLFSLMPQADIFVGIDSLPLHVAQAYGIHSFALFGATEPTARIVDFRKTIIIRNENLNCLGCYHLPGAKPFNKCALQTQACMTGLLPETVLDYVVEEIDPFSSNIEYLINKIRNK